MNSSTVRNDAAITPEREGEPVKLRRRIGSTTYTLIIKFSDTATETADEKILRLIEREVGCNA